MKKILQLFFIGFLLFNVINNTVEVRAEDEPTELGSTEIERSDEKISSYCPSASNPNLVSYCGRVTQALGATVVLSDGSTAPSVSQVPVKGVSVYLYECDNSSRTCKRDGLLSHPFSSTSTNKDGVFHLVGRKLENKWTYSYDNQYTEDIEEMMKPREVEITNQSKKNYLVFKCGNYFQGIHIIPSYLDLTEIIHEVNCPKELLTTDTEEFSYLPPLLQFDFIGGVKLAAQMGIEDTEGYYPEQRAEIFEAEKKAGREYDPSRSDDSYSGIEATVQAHYDRYANLKNSSVPVILKGADPRFTTPQHDAGKEKAIVNSSLLATWGLNDLADLVPHLGAWYGPDCLLKYKDYPKWSKLCREGEWEEELYIEPSLFTENLLPSLPPKQSLLYYRPLEIRNEISAYYQDHDDLAKYLGAMFSNCVGEVYKRVWETTPSEEDKPNYPDCEWLKQCNKAINPLSDVNSLTSAGPAGGMMAPNALETLDIEKNPDIPVCLIAGEEEPVKIDQIQRSKNMACTENLRLCENGAYWNTYYLTNLGKNNTALKTGYAGENKEDSYYRENTGENGKPPDDGSDVNSLAFQTKKEGKGEPRIGGQGSVQGSGDKGANNSGGAVMQYASGTEVSSTENFSNFLNQPFEDDEIRKEISKGVPYYISTRPVALGQFSKTNDYPETMVTNKEQDKNYLDPYAFGQEMECKTCGDEHYPEDLANSGDPDVIGGKEGSGARTPFEGLTITTTSKNRTESLSLNWKDNWKDNLDSAISVSTGHSYIDWNMAKVKGKPTLLDAMGKLWNAIVEAILGDKMINKTFADRSPEKLGEFNEDNFKINDELIAYGFKVNASNFDTLFTCPSSPGGDGSAYVRWPEPETENGKKAVKECYPWHPLEWGDTCGTARTCGGGMSKTCRVDVCEKGTVTIKYRCGSPYNPEEISRGDEVRTGDCTVFSSCVNGQSNSGVLPSAVELPADLCSSFSAEPTEHTYTGVYNYCTVSRAGPNECDGNILLDAEVATYSQTIDDQGSVNSPKSFNADEVPESGLNFFKAFQDPVSLNIAPLPAAWISVSSSLSETEPDVSLRKDIPGIGSGTSFLSRAQFGQPHPISPLNELEPLYIHCANTQLAGLEGNPTTGTWDDGKTCDFATLPDPEVITIEDLQKELDKIENPPCMLPENISACEQLILTGINPDGKPLKFSETFKLVLNLAGNKFGVEPAAILAYLHKTEADKEYSYLWSEEGEEDLKNVTLPWYGAFPFCDDLEPVKQPPYDWKLAWFSEMFEDVVPGPGKDSPKGVLTNLFKRQDTASRCNFLDSTFTLAASIAKNLLDDNNQIIACPQQGWDNYLKNSMKIQYQQIQVEPEYKLKGSLIDEEVFPSSGGYEEIWNACR